MQNITKTILLNAVKIFTISGLLFGNTIHVFGQDSTQTERNLNLISSIDGKTKMLLTAVAWGGLQANIQNADKTIPKTTFNDFGFSPMFLWKLSDKAFFEGEVEIKNAGDKENAAAFDLEFAKISLVLNKYITVGVGKMLSPFGAYNEKWEPVHIERFANTPFRPDDKLLLDDTHLFWGAITGLDVRGKIPIGTANLSYALFLDNGPVLHTEKEMGGMIQYENWNDNNSNKEIGGRIGLVPFANSSLEVGFSAKHGIASNQGDSIYKNVGVTAYAIDLNYVKAFSSIKSIISFRGQFNMLNADKTNYLLTDTSTYSFDNKLQSYFTQLSFRPAMVDNKYLKRLEFLLRFNAVTPPKEAIWNPGLDKNGIGGTIKRIDIGFDYWVSWRTGLRFAYEVTTNPDGTKSKQFLARLATGL